jgi:hypothetical protein
VSQEAAPAPAGAPLRLTELVRRGWPLYRSRFVALLGLFVAAYAVLAVVSILGAGVTGAEAAPDVEAVLVGTILPLALHAVVGSVATAAAIRVLFDASSDEQTGVGTALRGLQPRWKDILAAALLAAVLSLLAVFPPFSAFAALLGLALFAVLHGPPILQHVIVLEDRTLQQAGPRARAVLSRQWARLIMYLLTLALGARLLEFLLTAVLLLPFASLVGGVALDAAQVAVNLITLGILVPFIVAVMLVAFLDLRARAEPRSKGTSPD